MKTAALVRKGGELALSGPALTELMTAVLARGKAFRFRAKGWSMSPFVKDGDVLTVRPFLGRDPRSGEIVAFLHPTSGHVAVHRIVGLAGGTFLVRGDNAHEADGALARDRILGAVTEIVRDGRKVRDIRRGLGPVLAVLSRTGGLVRGLEMLRRLVPRPRKGAS